MARALILMPASADIRNHYATSLAKSFPEVEFVTADHRSNVENLIPSVDVMLTYGSMLSEPFLQKATRLKWIQSFGTGVDGLADREALSSDVIITRLHGILPPVSEAAIAAMFMLSRNVRRTLASQQEHRWDRFPPTLLYGKTLGILGIGVIAEHLAPKCQALGMKVIGISSSPRTVAGFDQVIAVYEMPSVISSLDYLVVLTPYSKTTHHLINEAVLSKMKPSSYLINLARGAVVDDDALIPALRQRLIAGAALDVFVSEPLPQDHPYWSMDNVIVTPHTGGFCDTYPDFALPKIEHNMRCFLKGNIEGMLDRVERAGLDKKP
jgi:D-2-hydroxyacid dehydrogenase (NADP+)